MANKKEHAYMLTINNPTDADAVANRAILDNPELFGIVYFVVGYEHYNVQYTKRKLTPHFQITVVFSKPVSFYHVKKLFPRAHIEVLWATLERAALYCKKESFFLEGGSLVEASKLLGEALPAVQGDKGVSITPLSSPHPFGAHNHPGFTWNDEAYEASTRINYEMDIYSDVKDHPKGWD